ncbi:hypothetical protein F5887DRAFT_1280539 [Amanita rubescens]|nr:hypothetical protein F5887DRAFT_1280539 [Amanita rubescens]
MSFARVGLRLARRTNTLCTSQHRLASNAAQGHHDSHSKEDFSSPIWRNAFIASLVAVAVYNYAPEPGDKAYLTRWIAFYQTSREGWLEMNARHTAKQLETSEQTKLFNNAHKEPVHRYRYPQIMDQSSPFLNGVGM